MNDFQNSNLRKGLNSSSADSLNHLIQKRQWQDSARRSASLNLTGSNLNSKAPNLIIQDFVDSLPMGVPFLIFLAIVIFLLFLFVRKLWYEQHYIGPQDQIETLIENLEEMEVRLSKVTKSLSENGTNVTGRHSGFGPEILLYTKNTQCYLKYKAEMEFTQREIQKLKSRLELFIKNDTCSRQDFN